MSKKQTVFNLLFLVIVFGLTMYLVFAARTSEILSVLPGMLMGDICF